MLGGGLRAGLVTEVFGHPGTGKTQLCLTAAVTSLLTSSSPGLVFYVDTKGDFSADRFLQILGSRSPEEASSGSQEARDRLRICTAITAEDLVKAVDLIERLEAEVSLVVVDNISLPVMRLVIHGDIGKGMGIGSRVSQSLQRYQLFY